ncbi:hypothetical protein QTG54_005189 [Skeletonema marinoi]|uniref:Uncharacterized protein n=1 Tax=Skeletonema marinoi TaxID=267567 RepID=A0AAD9DEF6_9STRA|nr:hypothetical protein QTG54_005189 [Skeletonema marinoi]
MEEVETLPTIEYTSCSSESDVMSSSEEDDRQSGSSSSRGLELRDKTDMPYLMIMVKMIWMWRGWGHLMKDIRQDEMRKRMIN